MSEPVDYITLREFQQFEKRVEDALKRIDDNVKLALEAKRTTMDVRWHNTSLYVSLAALGIALVSLFIKGR